ncbi:carbon-nitrogen hydrolase family protein [Rhodoblastus sp.]|uniref:carbon-nitrogen hydrolase family protein n=1 Tax=Rhodoblastus sp. TaxID=1962975 RepID=UPI0026394731|nr:carbon-nitrogen hydrolase family protein [Rhodoblastus sp.]
MKTCVIQMNSTGDKSANLEQARRLIEVAVAQERPDWIGLPEVFDFLGGSRAEKFAAAEILRRGPAYDLCAELAAKHGVFLHAGSLLEKNADDERLSNTTVVFDRLGREIALYRKIHMFDVMTPDGAAYRESATFRPGDEVVTYQAEGVTFGCAICYDIRFPALFQALGGRGAQAIVLPSAFTLQTGKDHWEVLCRARAIETQCYFLAPAQVGAHTASGETRLTYGHSLICDPWGHKIAMASDAPGYAAARLDPALIARVRAAIPVAAQRRDTFV